MKRVVLLPVGLAYLSMGLSLMLPISTLRADGGWFPRAVGLALWTLGTWLITQIKPGAFIRVQGDNMANLSKTTHTA